ncbi:glutamate--cysteine ligase [Komagataeibacter europaeus NBRC 3261]|uniref:Glutamate--cysteine ligase n=1 Tax=Komagataeibacter europaeus NBRC 3261 TaxID=1234669 RepID=A0A0D6PYD5_KOMEU|nr:glutamate--cysteine ligase [Komagataeibacter europaeus]GAN96058.1 glutamate--cysteine ligase [Komagataeibacter europaeus NBRC 3261]
MSNPGAHNSTVIESFDQMVAILAAGARPRSEWRIGTEHEKFGFVRPDAATPQRRAWSSPPYAPQGIEALLRGLAAEAGGRRWEEIIDRGALIGLKGLADAKGGSISLEPGGQFELSGAPLVSLHDTRSEMDRHFAAIRPICDRLGIGFAPLGFHPTARRSDIPWMPKSRYAIMRDYMPKVGTLGLDMMLRTCTVQVNLDFGSEADMARKMRVSLALQPVATALFASSPFYEGHPNGYLSNRGRVWTDTDNARAGMPRSFMEDGFSFATYVDWLLDVPMYFVTRDDRLIDVAGCSFRDWLAGRCPPGLEGTRPTIGDFEDHMTTAFPDVRLKQFLEMRGADAGSPAMMLAQSALWTGLLYDDATVHAAEKLVLEHGWDDYIAIRGAVPRTGLNTPWGQGTLRPLAARMIELATDGLRARNIRDAQGHDETRYLAPLHEIAVGGPTQAEAWLAAYHGRWKGDVTHIFAEAAV